MPNTTNYSFPTPADTDLVKNGADAIRDLGDAVDTAMNTALGTKKAGMVLLNTTSFSGVSSGSVNDVFSSTYENYQIVATLVGTTVEAFNMRLRVSGADNSTNNYYFVGTDMNSSSASLTVRGGDPNTSWRVGTIGNDFMILTINLGAPQTANKTAFNSASGAGNATNEGYGGTFSGFFSGTTSFTGFTILGASNFSGTVRTYGVAN